MIGDSYEADIIGAQEAGIEAVFFNEQNIEVENPVFQVKHLLELKIYYSYEESCYNYCAVFKCFSFAQESYKYVIVPKRFSIFNEDNRFNLNTLTKSFLRAKVFKCILLLIFCLKS